MPCLNGRDKLANCLPDDPGGQLRLSRLRVGRMSPRSKAATDAGAQAIKAIKGELVSVHVIAPPASDVEAVLPKKVRSSLSSQASIWRPTSLVILTPNS